MTNCTRCGTPTNRPALGYSTIQKTDPLKDFTDRHGEDVNGVIYLCDSCIIDLKNFLLGKEIAEIGYYG